MCGPRGLESPYGATLCGGFAFNHCSAVGPFRHSHHDCGVYGPLLAGATSVMFEGVPTWPDAGRFWDVVDKYKVNQFFSRRH